MPAKSYAFLTLLVPLVAAQGATTVETLLFPGTMVTSWVGSLVASQATAKTYDLSCPASVSDLACSIAPIRVTEGVSRVQVEWAAKTSGTLTIVANGSVSCTATADKLSCVESISGTTALTTTMDNASKQVITAQITAGLGNQGSPTTGTITNNGNTQPTSPPTNTSPAPSPSSAASKINTSNVIIAGTAIGLALAAVL